MRQAVIDLAEKVDQQLTEIERAHSGPGTVHLAGYVNCVGMYSLMSSIESLQDRKARGDYCTQEARADLRNEIDARLVALATYCAIALGTEETLSDQQSAPQ